jgi:alpha-1,3-rhamnosyl/mannosyltransferase
LPASAVIGTSVYAMELLKHLPRSIDLSVLVSSPELRAAFQPLGLRIVDDFHELGECQIFHRPSQFFHPDALELFLNVPAHPVITFLDLISYRTPALFGNYDAYQQHRALAFASLHAAQAVLTISEHSRREIIDEFRLPPERVHAIHLGVDQQFFGKRERQKNLEVLRKWGITGPYFFCSGRDYPHKNLGLLLQGYALLRSIWKGPGQVPGLVLVGNPSHAPGAVFDLGKAPAPGVKYLGTVDREEVPALYQESLAFVYPSTYEGFGLPILEAMAGGTPVLCSRLTSVPEVAGDAALYLDELSLNELAEKMVKLATDEELRRRLIDAGLERARAFRWEETARKTAEVYAAVAAHPAPDALLRRQMIGTLASMDFAAPTLAYEPASKSWGATHTIRHSSTVGDRENAVHPTSTGALETE